MLTSWKLLIGKNGEKMTGYITVQQGEKIIKKMIRIIELNEKTIRMIQSLQNEIETHSYSEPFFDCHNLLISAGMHKKQLKDLFS